MALAIGTNNAALNAAASASRVNRVMETSMARLSTGKRINSASDDAAGVAISSRLSAEIRGTDQAIRNSLDGQALIDTAEGAHKEVENILQRMREIAVQAANDTNNLVDRANLSGEMEALSNEIDRIAATTTWAGKSLFNTAWLIQHGCALSTEYTHRYGKEHGCRKTLFEAKKIFHRFADEAITCYSYVQDYAFAGPDEFKYDTSIDTLTAYKRYIRSKPWVASNYLRDPSRKPDWI